MSINEFSQALDVDVLRDAIAEANRCLNCKRPLCQEGCPISNDIPEFIEALARGDLGEARKIIARKSNLPAVCGRICAHEIQCEGHCVLEKRGQSIKIGMLERVIADFSFDMAIPLDKVTQKGRGRVAVIGSGPAGLTVAGDLAKEGFEVVVFEALAEAGGILLYGIPSFRLSKKIVRREVKNIEALGVRVQTNCMVGRDITVDGLLDEGFDAVFIGSGTAISKELDLQGKDMDGIIQSSYFLRMTYLFRSGQIKKEEVPVDEHDKVLVIGAGNVAMDAARTAKWLGAKNVRVVYKGVREQISALESEYNAAVEEGVDFEWNSMPIAYEGENGTLTGLSVETDGQARVIEANKVLLAVGSRPANRIVSSTKGIDVDALGYVVIKERPYGMTMRRGVFAGGDVVHRPATVVLAMKEAKKVAAGIRDYIDAVKLLQA